MPVLDPPPEGHTDVEEKKLLLKATSPGLAVHYWRFLLALIGFACIYASPCLILMSLDFAAAGPEGGVPGAGAGAFGMGNPQGQGNVPAEMIIVVALVGIGIGCSALSYLLGLVGNLLMLRVPRASRTRGIAILILLLDILYPVLICAGFLNAVLGAATALDHAGVNAKNDLGDMRKAAEEDAMRARFQAQTKNLTEQIMEQGILVLGVLAVAAGSMIGAFLLFIVMLNRLAAFLGSIDLASSANKFLLFAVLISFVLPLADYGLTLMTNDLDPATQIQVSLISIVVLGLISLFYLWTLLAYISRLRKAIVA